MNTSNTLQKFVCYFRVSTNKQSLGLDAQKTVTDNYTKNGIVIKEFTEKESGKNDNRIELDKAIKLCKNEGAILVIAKLDRLSRNLTFVSTLMDSKLDFVCCDMPTANKLTISIFAAIAQNERETISKRTKDALTELKKKYRKDALKEMAKLNGVPVKDLLEFYTTESLEIELQKITKKLGTPANLTNKARQKGVKVIQQKAKENQNNRLAKELIMFYIEKNFSYREIASKLNELDMKTSRNKEFVATTVMRLHKRND